MHKTIIGYEPLPDEPDYHKSEMFSGDLYEIILPQTGQAHPYEWARKCKDEVDGKVPTIVLPGQAFDRFGARHGRGGGWYDRFLSSIPREWPRIGVCFARQLSEKSLEREKWDEPVDFLLVFDDLEEKWYETKARNTLKSPFSF